MEKIKKSSKVFMFIASTLFSISLFAGVQSTHNPERKRINSETFTEQVYKKFEKLQEMIADEMYVEARSGLNKLLEGRLNNFENATVNQYIGWVDLGEGKYIEAAKRFQVAIESDSLPNQTHFKLMLQMAQIYFASEQYQNALNILERYYDGVLQVEDKTYAFEANIYFVMEDYDKAIPIISKAISLSEKPQEKWNYLLYAAYKQTSKYRQAAAVMEKLIQINPSKKEYWKYLSADYFNLKEDKKSLAVLALAKESGLIAEDEKEIVRLFQLYSYLEIPYSAGKVLEKGLKDGVVKPSFKRWEDLGKTWYAAAEMDNALKAYNEASKLATDGKIDLYRAYIYLDKEDWNNLIASVNTALEKGGLKDYQYGKAWMLIGNAHTELKRYSQAIAAFKEAAKYPKSRKGANQWIDHLHARAKQEKRRAEIETANAAERAANAIK